MNSYKKRIIIYAVSLLIILIVNTLVYQHQEAVKAAKEAERLSANQKIIDKYRAIDPHDKRLDYSLIFDENEYMEINPDIAEQIEQDQLLAHFIQYGMDEGRRANDLFDIHAYIENNSDLRLIFGDNVRLYYYHYMLYGHSENRIVK